VSSEASFPDGGVLAVGADDGHVAAGGVRYRVRRLGSAFPPPGGEDAREAVDEWPAAPAALLLHDVAGDLADWDVLARELAADRVALAVAPKGLGGSEDRAPYTGAALAGELAALVLHAVDGPVDVVGHGTGATLAWNLAAHRPDLVRRVVLISGGRALPPWTVAWLLADVTIGRGRPPAGRRAGGFAGGAGTGQAGGPAELGEAAHRGRIRAAYARLGQSGQISPQRALVLWGTRDMVSPLATGQRIVATLTRSVHPETVRMVTLPGVGHAPLTDSPGRCAALVAEFLRAP
jgi:pimeloyl-ACP methyl ester carboxylesterase